MRYDRKIKYLDYCENGQRVRGSGFVKLEVSGGYLKLELTVKGVRGVREYAGDVILCGSGGEEVLGKIQLVEGQGDFRHLCQMDIEKGRLLGSAGLVYDELTGIRIPLEEGREITCKWEASGSAVRSAGEQAGAGSAEKQTEVKAARRQTAEEAVGKQAKAKAARRQEVKESVGKQAAGSTYGQGKARSTGERPATALQRAEAPQDFQQEETGVEGSVLQRAKAPQDSRQEGIRAEDSAPRRMEESAESREVVPLLENKWLQLCAIYPHINPFRDQREYLSIGPEDFVLLSSESYKAASNSFMLHGYYNYRHLILTREERRGEIVYYVGVPGNYYDREKQVAIMFGFESFECAQEPAQSSDFGYYMMKVQL